MRNQQKIPSVVSFSAMSERRERQFGADLSTNAIAMVHTKLQLVVDETSTELDHILESLEATHNLNFQYVKMSEGLPRHTLERPESIVKEYLQRVFYHLIESESESFSDFAFDLRSRTPVDIVVTIPAKWNYRAKNSTFRALTEAGFKKSEDTFPRLRNVLVITEPEAAAFYTARYLKEENGRSGYRFKMRVGELFILCDAGGGTVDVVTYRVKQLEPFQIERVGISVGDSCGAIFVNIAFKKWLRGLMGQERYHELDPSKLSDKISTRDVEGEMMRNLMREFEAKKKAFEGLESRTMHIDLPDSFHDITTEDETLKECHITISAEEMKSFFEPCITKILRLIHNQLDDIASKRTRPRNVFLVGGFAESLYLQTTIRESLDTRPGSPRIELRIPDTSWTAVVRGAVIFGVEKAANEHTTTMRQCPRSYGILVNKPYSKVEHDEQDLKTDNVLKTDMAQEQLEWLIIKGDLILSNEIMEVSVHMERNLTEPGSKKGSIAIYAYDAAYDDDPLPSSLSKSGEEPALKKLRDFEYDLSRIQLQHHALSEANGQIHVASLCLKIRIVPGCLRVQLCLQTPPQVINSAMIADKLLNNIVCPALEGTTREHREEDGEGSSS